MTSERHQPRIILVVPAGGVVFGATCMDVIKALSAAELARGGPPGVDRLAALASHVVGQRRWVQGTCVQVLSCSSNSSRAEEPAVFPVYPHLTFLLCSSPFMQLLPCVPCPCIVLMLMLPFSVCSSSVQLLPCVPRTPGHLPGPHHRLLRPGDDHHPPCPGPPIRPRSLRQGPHPPQPADDQHQQQRPARSGDGRGWQCWWCITCTSPDCSG
jgi:hypothetical protein